MAWTARLLTIAVLIALMGCFTGAQANYRRPTRVGVTCCKEVSRGRIPPDIKLTAYKHQPALSPCVDAIIFYAEKERYCTDPKARWIQNRLQGLKELND
ncbi:chemokine (C-C motif) ligand 34b, duplicate 4 precursor [Danio rerio]|uniref:Chemokine (C-C motif) ligand 34b, duplicate 4 n=1 Tax=Danio rerio TaxID=7955 RepID=F1QP63_DANRE|nr:chemokine (C-C motif) ligand 34b, duplicate 4 precursor [Danio rerio]|eukprot:NP_001108521.2 chemokine CCL-C24j precursor [Danio rerio]